MTPSSEALAVNLTTAWQETLGHIRIERPVAPLAFLWPLWVGLAGYGVLHRGLPRPFSLLMLIATLPMAVLILLMFFAFQGKQETVAAPHFVVASA